MKDHVQTEWNTLIATGVIVPAYIRAIEAVKKFWFHDKKPIENEINHFSMLNFYHHLFPDPSKAPSDFWRMLMKFLYKELSDKELPLFPVVFSDTRNMEWVSAVRRDAFPGYFSNLEWLFKKQCTPLSVPSLMLTSQYDMARKTAQELTTVLKDINMKILYAPYKIFQYFVESGVQEVKEVTPENVIIFLKSAKHRRSDGCCIADLPQQVGATHLKTCENIKTLLNYVKDAEDFLSQLDGLPLCLRQSQAVYVFEKSERKNLPFVSTFLDLLPGSYDSFVHESIMERASSLAPMNLSSSNSATVHHYRRLRMITGEWQTLLMESGMVCDVSHVKFLEFARCVEEDGKRGISRIVEKRSHLLVNHLFSREDLREDHILRDVRGSFIPVEEHCFLDNSFHQYSEGEYVGFEIYDPAINDDDEAEVLLDTSECEANPVYIYAVVRGMEQKKRLQTAINEVSDGSETYQEKTAPHDIKAVLRKIRETLIEAWQLPDEADRRRIIKRLILTWHPDKNRDNEAFCTRVMQMLNHYIERLGRGEKIRIDEDEDEQEHVDSGFYTTSASSSFSSSTASSSSSSSYSHFFDFMKRRAEQHRDYYQSSSCSSTPTPNKQTGEGRRWFRQAQADLRFAHTARDSFRQGYNWICYHCHQAVEKAIKAVLFSKDANSFPETSHDITLLASLTGDSGIIGWAREIENIVGFHTRMRYPDALTYPSIPDDVYTADQASRPDRYFIHSSVEQNVAGHRKCGLVAANIMHPLGRNIAAVSGSDVKIRTFYLQATPEVNDKNNKNDDSSGKWKTDSHDYRYEHDDDQLGGTLLAELILDPFVFADITATSNGDFLSDADVGVVLCQRFFKLSHESLGVVRHLVIHDLDVSGVQLDCHVQQDLYLHVVRWNQTHKVGIFYSVLEQDAAVEVARVRQGQTSSVQVQKSLADHERTAAGVDK
ncbi:hypothetical protein C0Q70_06014 [Pomacea canaliculata]|uniref:HEPN domain-containing protein n=1 Tax=Pomacea canaliculata TaxID=400727 RepID=A0A2T7PN03_POMCA|nr:hypothetical protein C0Q70_06014 [Pomacea canaliculata]